MHLIGLGNTGCALVKQLSKYPQYKVLELDEGKGIPKQSSPEKYEENCPSFSKQFKGIDDDVWLMLSASGNISGLSLKLLEQLRGKNLNVLCVVSDPSLLPSMAKLQQNLVKGVFQEYARSGLLQQLLLVDNTNVEEMLGEVAIDEYWDKLNEVITYLFHTIQCFKHEKPILETKEEKKDIARISTLGLYDQEKNRKLLYNLENITTERYFYSFSKQEIKQNGKILPGIKRDLLREDSIVRTFGIYESVNTEPYACMEVSTHIIYSENQQNRNA